MKYLLNYILNQSKKDIKYKIGSKVKDSGSIIAAKKIAIFT